MLLRAGGVCTGGVAPLRYACKLAVASKAVGEQALANPGKPGSIPASWGLELALSPPPWEREINPCCHAA